MLERWCGNLCTGGKRQLRQCERGKGSKRRRQRRGHLKLKEEGRRRGKTLERPLVKERTTGATKEIDLYSSEELRPVVKQKDHNRARPSCVGV